jgi:hypothetical protein
VFTKNGYTCKRYEQLKIEVKGSVFEFITMHAREVKFFQVYVMDEGKKARFHMQINDDGEFIITNKAHCPEHFIKQKSC